MLKGPSIDLYKEMLEKFPNLYLMASGGVSNVDDIIALNEAGVPESSSVKHCTKGI